MYIIEAEGTHECRWWMAPTLNSAIAHAEKCVESFYRVLIRNPNGVVIWGE